MSGSLRAARIGPRSVSGTPVRRRSSKASTALAARACSGHPAPPAACRAPSTRPARPAATGSATRGRSPGSKEASQSMKQTTSAVAAESPAQHAAPKPGTGSRTTRAPSRSASSPEPSVEPLSATIGS